MALDWKEILRGVKIMGSAPDPGEAMCSCNRCGWIDFARNAVSKIESEGWEYPEYIVHDCLSCGEAIEDYYGSLELEGLNKLKATPVDPFTDWRKQLNEYAESYSHKNLIDLKQIDSKGDWLEYYLEDYSPKDAYIADTLEGV